MYIISLIRPFYLKKDLKIRIFMSLTLRQTSTDFQITKSYSDAVFRSREKAKGKRQIFPGSLAGLSLCPQYKK